MRDLGVVEAWLRGLASDNTVKREQQTLRDEEEG